MKPTIEKSDTGYWVRFGNRLRFVSATPEELSQLDLLSLEKTKRAFKRGSHEKSFFYREPDGTICIPHDPSDVPIGTRLEEISDLASADRLSKEMAGQHYRKFQDDGAFTEMMEQNLGGPRKALVDRLQNPKSNYERDLVRHMLSELDNSRHDLSRIESESHFHWRES